MTTSIQKYFQHQLPTHILSCLIYLEECVQNSHFTAWSFANEDYHISAFWADEYGCPNQIHTQNQLQCIHPVFDLASLTKPLFLNLFLRERAKQNFPEWVKKSILSWKKADDFQNKDLYRYFKDHPNHCLDSFLSHRSGLAPWCWMGYGLDKKEIKNELTQWILTKKSSPTDQELYSDLNYFILARVLEELGLATDWAQTLKELNQFCQTSFFHASLAPEQSKHAVPYFPYLSTSQPVDFKSEFGSVHDTNANILSGLVKGKSIVSGHAGLFGNISDVVSAVKKLAQTQFEYDIFTQQNPNFRFQLGLDSRKEKEDSTQGHLGYTGTSFWFHKNKKTSEDLDFHVLLTNRTSQRHTLSKPCKRAYLIQNTQQNSLTYYLKDMEDIQSCTQDLWLSEILEIKKSTEILWNSQYILAPHDLSHIRKFIAEKLWNT